MLQLLIDWLLQQLVATVALRDRLNYTAKQLIRKEGRREGQGGRGKKEGRKEGVKGGRWRGEGEWEDGGGGRRSLVRDQELVSLGIRSKIWKLPGKLYGICIDSSSSTALPKSLTITLPFSSMRRLSSFKSLCTTFWEWRKASPSRRWWNHCSTFVGCKQQRQRRKELRNDGRDKRQ